MKTAIITPIPDLEKYAHLGDNYHLILCHLAIESEEYRNYYAKKIEKGDFVILDNSAHEFGVGKGIEYMIKMAKEMNVSEVVLPDRLFFGDDTLSQAIETIEKVRTELPTTKIMGVPQGRTLDEYLTCLKGLIELKVDTIGISKDYEPWPGGLAGLVAMVNLLSPTTEIHLLGWGRDLKALYSLGQYSHLKIRGVDSAKPLVYADHNLSLNILPENRQPQYPRRVENFFNKSLTTEAFAYYNIAIFQAWAKGKNYIDAERFMKIIGVTYKTINYETPKTEVDLDPESFLKVMSYTFPDYITAEFEDLEITVGGILWRCVE